MYSRSPFRKPKRKPFFWPSVILLSTPLVLILLELLVRIVAGIRNESTLIATYQGEPEKITAYRVQFLDSQWQPYDGLKVRGLLKAKRSQLTGYRLASKQQSNFWQINPQGFRTDAVIPMQKPQGEIRIFVLGGSAAFGQLSSNNSATFASQLEVKLNDRIKDQKANSKGYRPAVLPYFKEEVERAMALRPKIRDGTYRVINAAVPGYTSGNELAYLTSQVLNYSPDMLIVLNGYADLSLPSSQEATDIPDIEQFLSHSRQHYFQHLTHQAHTWVESTYLVRGFQYWFIRPRQSDSDLRVVAIEPDIPAGQLAITPKELEERVRRYRMNMRQMTRIATAAKIPLFIALQPEITGRGNSSNPDEQAILSQLNPDYPQWVQSGYQELEQSLQQIRQEVPSGLTILNFYHLYPNSSERVFWGPTYLTDAGNQALADKLFDTITQRLFVQPQPNPQ